MRHFTLVIKRTLAPERTAMLVIAAVGLCLGTTRAVTFSDGFVPAPSSLWNNYAGNWTAVDGQYYAQNANNNPLTSTQLPFVMGDFTATVTVDNLTDGGIWIHADGTNQNGILLVLGGNNYGQGGRGGDAGSSIYWTTLTNGGGSSGIFGEATNVFTPGDNYTITVTGVGDIYSAMSTALRRQRQPS